MDPLIAITQPAADEAGIVSRIVQRSIRDGCALDHRNDASLVEAWTRHKGCDQVARWLLDEALCLRLAWLQGKPVGAGMALASGEVCLCYVQPESFRRGAGRALMAALEHFLGTAGHSHAMLYSTRTAAGFYARMGYRPMGRPVSFTGLVLTPMRKPLAVSAGAWHER
ncbi:GNAT family N-acetyltransferase [Pseudomonas sp.]|uniref:GNAT family N-acetyltransferase n=1 Tax=Pseudomonas sp. TaxID=306 RepID=UPI0025877250|nr:GNAT family N-acetyltransferase [Pseudomonas sp.]